MEKEMEALERLTEGESTTIVCSCGERVTWTGAEPASLKAFNTAHKVHYDHLAKGYVAPTVIR